MKSAPGPEAGFPINIGISEEDRKRIAKGLSAFLADSYTLYMQTHNFHWNV
ncbi:MAG: DNA starvation/stationary phase protection protein, partial [Betaproteobacteria bacterium]|nr:DNA starvation/stationary phase protection protein [Betaproteobacteria bacterium]NCX04030.1 DNA starvation/stationary phase protection protein [Betaproteobacteria bacterium]